MSVPLGDSSAVPNCCCPAPGTTTPGLAPYVVSLNGLYGIITLDGVGAIDVTSSGNTIFLGLSASAGLGTVTQVAAEVAPASAAALAIAGSPINTFGTFTFTVDPALVSIAGLTTAADTGIYTTAANTYATFTLTAVGRTLVGQATQALMRTTGLGSTTVGDAVFTLTNPSAITFLRINANNSVTARTATEMRSDLSLVIGTNVQAWSADLDSFVTHASWAGNDLTLAGGLTLGENLVVTGTGQISGTVDLLDALNVGLLITAIGGIDLGGSNAVNGAWEGTPVAADFGGTGLAVYAVGDLLYANTTTTLARRAAVAAGKVLTSQGVGAAPIWDDASNLAINVPASKLLVVSTTGDNALGARGFFNHQYLNIQNAINAAQSGDTVLVLPGTYTEGIELANGVTVVGWGRPYINGFIGCFNANTCEIANFHCNQISIEAGTLVKLRNITVTASTAASAAIVDAGATAYFYDCDVQYTNASTSFYALEVSGTVRAENCRFKSTQANCHGVLIAGNLGQFLGCLIISGTGGNSFSAASAQTVGLLLPCSGNTSADSDVSFAPNAGWNVDSLMT